MQSHCKIETDNEITHLSDTQLITEISEKEELAFIEIYSRYNKYLLNFVYLIVKDRGESEEVVQEVFFQIWNKADKYNPKLASFSTWVMTIARNKALDKLRRLRYKQKTSDIEQQKVESASENSNVLILQDRKNQLIRKAINKLPQKQKSVINVVYFEGFTHTEAAMKLNVPVGTVKTRLRLGIIKLRNLIQKKTIDSY